MIYIKTETTLSRLHTSKPSDDYILDHESYIVRYKMKVIKITAEDDTETEDELGTVSGWLLDMGKAANDNRDPIDICDSHSQDLYQLAEHFFSEDFEDQLEGCNHIMLLIDEFTPGLPVHLAAYAAHISIPYLDVFAVYDSEGGSKLRSYGFTESHIGWIHPVFWINCNLHNEDFSIDEVRLSRPQEWN